MAQRPGGTAAETMLSPSWTACETGTHGEHGPQGGTGEQRKPSVTRSRYPGKAMP
jgi:hypothetical protein